MDALLTKTLTDVKKDSVVPCHQFFLSGLRLLVDLMATNRRTDRERSDDSSRLSFRQFQLAPYLQVHPELRCIPEPMGESQRGVTRDPTLAFYDLSDPIGRNTELACQLSRRHAKGLKSLGKNFTWSIDYRSHIALEYCRLLAPMPSQNLDEDCDDVRQSYITFAYVGVPTLRHIKTGGVRAKVGDYVSAPGVAREPDGSTLGYKEVKTDALSEQSGF